MHSVSPVTLSCSRAAQLKLSLQKLAVTGNIQVPAVLGEGAQAVLLASDPLAVTIHKHYAILVSACYSTLYLTMGERKKEYLPKSPIRGIKVGTFMILKSASALEINPGYSSIPL